MQFTALEREAMKRTGAEGGSPFKLKQPTELEELALAYLGINKLHGKYRDF